MLARLRMAILAMVSWTVLAGSLAAQAPPASTAPAPAAEPSTRPAVAPAATQPAEQAAIRFQFDGENLRDLVRYFVPKVAGKPLMGDPSAVGGTFTYFDAQPYTPADALTIINYVLRMNGFTLLDKGRYIELVPVARMGADLPIIEIKPGELEEPRRPDDEIVTAIVPLKFIDSEQASAAIARMVHSYGALAKMGKGNKGLIITDSMNNIRRIQRMLASLDKGSMVEMQMKSYPLKHASAEEVARLLEKVLGAGQQGARRWVYDAQSGRYTPAGPEPGETVQVAFDARSNMVVMMGSAEKLAMAEEIIAKVDLDQPAGEGAIRIFELKNAKAEDLAKTINAAISQQATVRVPGGAARSVVARVVADPGSNRLVVSAPPDIMKQVEDLVTKLDGAAVDAGGVRLFALKNANAPSLVTVIQNAFARRDLQGRSFVNFSVSADARSNTLVVNAPAADTDAIAKLIEQLDQPPTPETGREIHVVRLEAGDARELADALKRLLAERPGPRGQTDESAPRIEADRSSNSLIVACPPGDWLRIKSLLDQLKAEVIPQLTAATRIFPLKHARAGELIATLQQIFDPRRRRAPSRGQPEPVPAVVSYDSQTNTIIASASSDDLAEMERTITMLDVAGSPEAQLQVRTYALTGANAAELARSLDRLFAAQAPKGPLRPGAAVPAQPRFEAEPASNQLIVVATAEQFQSVIDGLIQKMQMKIEETTQTAVKLYPLKHARADQVLEAVRRVVETHVASLDRSSQSRQRRTDYQVSADTRTNSLLVTAPAETQALVEKLLTTLDSEQMELATVTRIVELTNADANEVAQALNAALGGQPSVGGRTPAAAVLAGKRVTVVPAPSARAVLLTGSQEDIALAEKLIKQLDVRQPPAQATVRTFPLKYAKAEDLARVLSDTVGAMTGLKGTGAISTRVSADRNANAIVVSAANEVVERIAELLKQLDVEGAIRDAVTVEIVRLQYARADAVAAALNSAQPAGAAPQRPGQRPQQGEDVLRATADVTSNSLLLTGRRAQIDEAKKLIAQMDKATSEGEAITQMIPLENADATEVANAVNAALVGQEPPAGRGPRGQVSLQGLAGKRIKVVPAQNARSVLLTGTKEDVAYAIDLIKKIDERPASGKAVLRNFAVKFNKAEDLARLLNDTVGKATAGRSRPGAVPANISADKGANTVVVSADGETVEQIAKLIQQLDVPESVGGAVKIEIVKLKNAKADQMAAALNAAQASVAPRPGAPRGGEEETVKVTPEPISNTLLLTGRASQIEETKKLIAQLDEGGLLVAEMRIFPLRFAKAGEVLPVLQTILTSQAISARGRPTGTVVDVRIAAQDKANAIVVQAPPDVVALAEQIIKEFDQETTAGTTIQIVKLSRAEAVSLAEAVNQALSDRPAGRPLPGQTPPETALVVPEANSNSLLVRGPKAEVDKAVALIKSLDEGGERAGSQVRTFPLKNADAVQVAKTLETLFRQMAVGQARQPGRTLPPAPVFSIAPDERTNSVIVSASAAQFAIVEDLLKKMDAEGDLAAREMQYIPLTYADGFTVASQVEALFEGRPRADRPTISTDFYSNSLAVIAKEADLRAIETVVAKLDEAAAKTYVRVKVIPLGPGVRAEKMAETLRRVYPQMTGSEVRVTEGAPPARTGAENLFLPAVVEPEPAATAPAQPATRPATAPTTVATEWPGLTTTPPGPAGPAGPPPVIITVDKATNSLVVSAGRNEMETIQGLIDQLTATVVAADAELRVFKIKHADVMSVARTLDALFNPRPVGQPLVLQPAGRQARQPQPGQPVQPAPSPQAQAQAQALAAFKPNITIAADARTRTVIVRGRPTDLEVIDSLLTQLDTPPEFPFEVRIFALRNTDAAEVATNLRELFGIAAGRQGQQAQPTPAAPGTPQAPQPASESRMQQQMRRLVELRTESGLSQVDLTTGVTISANRVTNSVIVTAPSDAMELVARLVQELDQSPAPTATAVRMFRIQKAEVSEVVDVVSRIFAQPTGRPAAGGVRGAGGGAVVAGNEAARSVVVSARSEDFPLIEKVIQELDNAGGVTEAVVKVYRLQYADARTVADALTRTLTQSAGARPGGVRGTAAAAGEPVRISPESSGNAVVVRAPQEEQQRIAQLILEMDQAPAQQATFQVIPLTRADAREVSDALNRMIQAWPRKANEPRPAVGYDRTTNSLMVSGPQKDMERIAQMVAELEAGRKEKVQVQLITLQHARASDLAANLGAFYGQRAAPGASPVERSVTITADDRTNCLLVSAPAEEFAKITALVAKMDADGGAGEPRKAVIALTYAQADAVAKAIAAAFAPPAGTKPNPADLVVASAEAATNSVVVSASEKNLQSVQELVKKLDVQPVGGRKIELVPLTNARAVDVAKVLSDVVARRGRPAAAGTEPPSVSAEPAGNILVVSGSRPDLDMLTTLARQLDQVSTEKKAEPQILALKNANAVQVADMVTRLMQQRAQQDVRAGKVPEPVAISADAYANAVVVAASPEQVQMITKLVNQIDEMSPGRANLRLIQLKNANVEDVLKAIQQIYGSGADGQVGRPAGAGPRGRGAGGARPAAAGGPQVTGLGEQRALLVNASDEDWEVIQKLIATLDEAAAGMKREVMVFPLTRAPNTQVATALSNMYRAAQRPNHPEDIVSVVPLPGTNAIVVAAVKEKMEEIAGVIKKFDIEIVGKMESRTYPLVNIGASRALMLLRQMMLPVQAATPTQPITIAADERSNTIIVTTQAPVFDQIESMIKSLDVVPAFKAAEVAVFMLKNADAPALANVLTDILTPGTSKIQTPEARALQEQVRLLQMQKGKEALPALDLSKPIKITSDPMPGVAAGPAGQAGSNSLIVSSTPENLKALAEIISLLDTQPIAKGVKVQVIHLRNSDAINVMTLLREVFTQGQRLAGRPGTPVAGRALPETVTGEGLTTALNVTADARTNTLIISGSEESVALAVLIVQDLDQQATSEFTEVRVFKLLNADAARLAPLVRQVLLEQPAGAPAGARGAQEYFSRLRMLREKEQPVQTEIARSHPTLVVQAESTANLLIVLARSDLMAIVAEMIKTMDIPGAGSLNAVRIYPLKNADATRMATVINGLYTGPNAALVRAEDRPTITVDTRTNSLVVASSDKTFGIIDALLVRLDAQLPVDLLDVRLVPLQNADAATLAPALQRMMDARVQREVARGNRDAESLRMVVLPDPRTNFLIVGGSSEGYKLVADLAKQLDAAPIALAGQIQLIPLTNASAGTLSATLVNLFTQRYAAVRDPNLQRQRPVIVPDLRTNMLLVAATQDDSQVIKSLVEKLDSTPTTPSMELVVLPLKSNDAGAVGPMMQRMFDARRQANLLPGQVPNPQDIVTILTDGVTNALIVSASKENLALIKDLLAKVDVEPPTETGVVRMYPLEHTDATRVADMLRALVQQGLYKPGLVSAAASPIAQAREKVSITTDIRTNVLIISASKENFAVIEEILKRIDTSEAWGLTGNIRLYMLKNADAARLGPTLQQMFDRKRAAEAATGGAPRSLPVVVVPDDRTNSLLVAASNEAFDAIDALVVKLDTSDILQTHQFAIFSLKQATAATLEPVLRQLFAARLPRGGPLTPVTVIADAKTNSLIVGGDKSDLLIAEDFIKRLDQPPPPVGQTMRVFPILKADAANLALTLQQLYAGQRPGGVSGVGITVDQRTNSLLVTAGEGDMANIADLIAKLDTTPVTDVTEIRIFTLRRALAAQLATVLNDALTNKPKALTPVSPNRATWIRFMGETADGRQLTASAIKEGVMITPFEQTNTLLVQAPVDTMPLLASLIDALDNVAPQTAEIHVFALVNADATQMARVLTELFRLQVAPAQRQPAEYTVVASPAGAGKAIGEQQPAAQFGTAEQSALTITVDRRTNSLLVGGTREYVALVSRVIEELDASPAQDRQIAVYRLRNAVAADIETALRQFLDQENQRVRSTLGPDAVGAAKELLAREIAIVAERTSNTLLISGSPRYFKTIASMVRELDQPPPQVLIQVLLAEVALSDTTELGAEWSLQAGPGHHEIRLGTSFGLAAKTDGLTFSVTGGDITPILRALQAQNRLEVLSRPQLTVTDNQQGNINIGQEVPFVTSSRIYDTGVVNTIEYRPVGIILNVTPRIGQDGFVRMQVNPIISSVTESSVKISETVNALIIDSRSAKTTVTCQDGHTIIVGGLITRKQQNLEDKVPILGDIPGIGLAFKSTKIIKGRTELLIILTPRVMRAPSDSDILTNKEVRQMHLARGMSTEASVGDLLNPLHGVTPAEVKRLEHGLPATQAASELEPVVIPLTPQERNSVVRERTSKENP